VTAEGMGQRARGMGQRALQLPLQSVVRGKRFASLKAGKLAGLQALSFPASQLSGLLADRPCTVHRFRQTPNTKH
jgi:hypothetical protein